MKFFVCSHTMRVGTLWILGSTATKLSKSKMKCPKIDFVWEMFFDYSFESCQQITESIWK